MTWLPVQEIQSFTFSESNALPAGNNYGQLSGSRVISELADFSGLILHLVNRGYSKMTHRSVCQGYNLLMSNGRQYFISAFRVPHYRWRICGTRRAETPWHDGKCQKHPWSERVKEENDFWSSSWGLRNGWLITHVDTLQLELLLRGAG